MTPEHPFWATRRPEANCAAETAAFERLVHR
jgi:hypothetical protein